MDNYQKLVDNIKNTDPSKHNNDFTRMKTVRTSKQIKDDLLLVSHQLNIPYSKVARFAVRTLKNNIPILTYKKLLDTTIKFQKSNNSTRYRFWIDKEMDELLNLRSKQLKTNKEDLINLVVFLVNEDYKKLSQEQVTYLES